MNIPLLLPATDTLPRHQVPSHYVLEAHLGEGGFGEVYAAWDSKLCRQVAIKFVKRVHDGKFSAELLREARAGASLRHAAFVKIHAIEEHGFSQSIIMELVPGRTLKEVLLDGAIGQHVALEWTRQIADAMAEAHASGLVHGDLKPSNLMIEPDGAVRVLDFGLALHIDLLATTALPPSELQGTLAYMAPERLHGVPPSAQTDIYALGLILYEMVRGARPFANLSNLELAATHLQSSSDGWTYPDEAGAPLIALIRAMTARQPERRLASMVEVRKRLANLPGPGVKMRPRAARGLAPRAWMLAGLLAAASLAGICWQTMPSGAPWQQLLTPYSDAREIEQALAALKSYDWPSSLDNAERHFQRVLAHAPDSAAAAAGMSLVYSYRYLGQWRDETWLQKADASAQRAVQLDGQLALSQIAAAWVLGNQGRPELALHTFERALQLDPGNFFAWYGQIGLMRRSRHYSQARARLADAIVRFPRERAFTDELGSVEYEQGNYGAAEQAFRRSIALQPDAVIAYANLNAALLRQNRDAEALQVVQQGLQIRPAAKLYTNLGNALFLRQDYLGAAAAFQSAISPAAGAPGDYLNWANLADALKWLPGRDAEARAAYERARDLLAPRLRRTPNDAVLVSRMALYAARTGATVQALTLLPRALALAPASADAQFRAGLAYELLGRRPDALQAIAAARHLGYPASFIDAEPDLVALRRDEAGHLH